MRIPIRSALKSIPVRRQRQRRARASLAALYCAVGLCFLSGAVFGQQESSVSSTAEVQAPLSLEVPAFELDFQTILDFGRTTITAPSRNPSEPRPQVAPFTVGLSDLSLDALDRQGLTQLHAQLLEEIPLRPEETLAARNLERWRLLEAEGQIGRLHEEMWAAFQEPASLLPIDLGLRLGDSLLRHGEPARAREVFTILRDAPFISDGVIRQVRQRIVESFFEEGLYQDAERAAQSFRRDYQPDQPVWKILEAKIAFALGQSEQALDALEGIDTVSAALWRVYGSWRAGQLSGEQALSELGGVAIPAESRLLTTTRNAMIALMSADPQFAATRTDALETLLAAPHTVDPLLDLDPSNELLGAYRVLGDQILVARGIDRQADPRAWELVFAGALLSELEARSLAILLVADNVSPTTARSPYAWLIRSCLSGNRAYLIQHYFGDHGLLAEYSSLDDEALMLLVDLALAQTDFPLAARLQGLVRQAPMGITSDAWVLRGARIQVLGGNPHKGAEQLARWMDQLNAIAPEGLDRVMQIMFDLQFLGEHKLALDLFEHAARLIRTADQKREIFFWIAQSWAGLGEPAKAAAYYLESASLAGPNDLLWQQSALYQAGQALETAELYDDATRIYQAILGDSSDTNMQAKLQYRLAQIQLSRIRGSHSD